MGGRSDDRAGNPNISRARPRPGFDTVPFGDIEAVKARSSANRRHFDRADSSEVASAPRRLTFYGRCVIFATRMVASDVRRGADRCRPNRQAFAMNCLRRAGYHGDRQGIAADFRLRLSCDKDAARG